MTVYELNRPKLILLKESYYSELVNEGTFSEVTGKEYDEPSWADLANIDSEVPDEVIFNRYDGVTFSDDDFFDEYDDVV